MEKNGEKIGKTGPNGPNMPSKYPKISPNGLFHPQSFPNWGHCGAIGENIINIPFKKIEYPAFYHIYYAGVA